PLSGLDSRPHAHRLRARRSDRTDLVGRDPVAEPGVLCVLRALRGGAFPAPGYASCNWSVAAWKPAFVAVRLGRRTLRAPPCPMLSRSKACSAVVHRVCPCASVSGRFVTVGGGFGIDRS